MDSSTLEILSYDNDAREVILRKVVGEYLALKPAPAMDDFIVATYFMALRTSKLADAVEEISYHATSGIHHPPPGSLLEQCSAQPAGIDTFDSSGRVGLLHIAFPLKMMLQPDGHLTSCDILHTVAAAVIFDFYENRDVRLVSLKIPEAVIRTFPGPAYGPQGIRKATGFAPDQTAFGTILKPTAGITPDEVGSLVAQAAENPLFLFIKEDEDLYPNLDYSPVAERTRRAVTAIKQAQDKRGGLGLIFAPHISGAPNEVLDTLAGVIDAGATAVMLSETFAGGTYRMVREATKHLERPPAIYGHNAGIGVKTRSIWREVIDMLARLDGIDFRQTAPVRPGAKPYIRPFGAEWLASEEMLTCPIPGIKPTMIARAGALDQGNIGLNLAEAKRRGITENILFLAGSAINSIKDSQGKADPKIGAAAMAQALEVFSSDELHDVPDEKYVSALAAVAERRHFNALREALRQRYQGV